MKRTLLFIQFVTFSIILGQSANKMTIIDEVFVNTGMEVVINQLPKSYFGQLNKQIPDNENPLFTDEDVKLVIDTMRYECKLRLAKLGTEKLQNINEFYTSELGKKIVYLETTGVYEPVDSVIKEKKELIDQLLNECKIEETVRFTQEKLYRATTESMIIIMFAQKDKFRKNIKEEVAKLPMDKLVDKTYNDLVIKGVFKLGINKNEYYQKYGNLTSNEIKEYADFYKTIYGSSYLEYTKEVTSYVFEKGQASFISKFDKAFEQKLKKNGRKGVNPKY